MAAGHPNHRLSLRPPTLAAILLLAGCVRGGYPLAGAPDCPCKTIHADDPAIADGWQTLTWQGKTLEVFCDMTTMGGGWTRVADLDAARDACPGESLSLDDPPACRMGKGSCEGETRSVLLAAPPVGAYSEVRGYVRGYQYKSTDAFSRRRDFTTDLDGPYVDGVSLTIGTQRRHLWTYAIGLSTDGAGHNSCPCAGGEPPPSYVGLDYHCDSANEGDYEDVWYPALLWGSTATDGACAAGADPTWFHRALAAPTASPIEVRLSRDQCDEDIAVSRLVLFVR